jgi:Ser/Thr protein kinase RdoA (MazF antagonist)
MLSDFPAATLHETIPNFHNTPDRFRQFRLSVEEDKAGRAGGVQDVIARLLQHEQLACTLQYMLDAGQLPLRVTHNDTKLNNVLLDQDTRQYLCVLDLDTVMPGISLYDFGDAIRFGAATGTEDTRDLDNMGIDLEAYRVYTRGFLETATTLTRKEIELLHLGPIAMTLELVARFLKDYLDGDLYFKTAYPEHNLVRSLAQLKLAEDMISKMDIMQQIVREELAKICA